MKYFVIAGEASGDLHGSNLIKQLYDVDRHAEVWGMGGDMMQSSGCRLVQHYKNMAFMGIINVVLNIRKVVRNINICKEAIERMRPDAVIFIDYPSFNLKMAKWIKHNHPEINTIYYIAPKLWAWKSYRIKSIRRYIDRMFTIFPFETEYFARLNYEVCYVGNPTAWGVSEFLKEKDNNNNKLREKYGIDNRPIVALLPGSRRQEVLGCLTKMMSIRQYFTDYNFVIAAAPGLDIDFYRSIVGANAIIVNAGTYQLLSISDVAIVNSGTATLETAMFGKRQVVVYNVFGGRLANVLKSIILKVKFVSLVNIISGKEVVKELIAGDFTSENLKKELYRILKDEEYCHYIEEEYTMLKNQLGNNNAAENCANQIVSYIEKTDKTATKAN